MTANSPFGSFPDFSKPIKLRITAVEGDEPRADDATPSRYYRQAYGTTVTPDGHVEEFYHSSRGSKGGGGDPPLSAETLSRVDELLSKLPDDGARLPPPNRRLLVETNMGDATITRVYDRANAPEVVWDILRLTRNYSIRSYVLRFEPSSQIDARGSEHGGFLRLTPDGKQLLFTGSNQPLQFWEPITRELLREIRGLGSDAIAFTPDGSRAVVSQGGDIQAIDLKTWTFTGIKRLNVYRPQFARDGRHVLSAGDRDLRAVDTATWKSAKLPPEIPQDAMRYMPAPGNRRAIAQLKSGAVILWDVVARRTISTLRDRARLLDTAFSPDESQVAVKTANQPPGRSVTSFGIWRADSGALVHELRPFERDGQEPSQGLLWSPDGEYVLTGTVPGSSADVVSVFSVATGKHRAQFAEFTGINGVTLLPDASQLVVGCEDGKIRFWDFPVAMKSVRAFEASLPPLSRR